MALMPPTVAHTHTHTWSIHSDDSGKKWYYTCSAEPGITIFKWFGHEGRFHLKQWRWSI